MPDRLPMFPLEAGLMPGSIVPLRLFEPRYLKMLDDCLDSNRMFGVVLIRRGSEVGGGDARFDIGTAVRIMGTQTLEDGTTLVVGRGVGRIRVDDWLEDDPYPQAMVTQIGDPVGSADPQTRVSIDQEFQRGLALLSELGVDVGAARPLPSDDVAALYQAISLLPVQPIDRQRALEMEDVGERAEAVLAMMRGANELAELRLSEQ